MKSFPQPRPIAESAAFARYQQLTMPPGALGGVLEPALRLLAQRPTDAQLGAKGDLSGVDASALHFLSLVFAGDHGVAAAHPVSAFPPAVTAQMILNFLRGGAAMSVLARLRNAPMAVVDVGVASAYAKPPEGTEAAAQAGARCTPPVCYFNKNLTQHAPRLYAQGAADITQNPALQPGTFAQAFAVGEEIFRAMCARLGHQPDAIILGEMGIGNTTPAAAIVAHCLDVEVELCTGAGTGLDSKALKVKSGVIRQAVVRHENTFGSFGTHTNPDTVIASLGGFELAAMAGAGLAAARQGVHILLDGVIAMAALLPYMLNCPGLSSWVIAAHCSAEPAHALALKKLGLEPLLRLGFRLGEGSGAGFAAGLLQDAVYLLNNMATFDSAGISQG